MRRRQGHPTIEPEDAAALWRESAPVRRATVTAKCELITPMYGGGVEEGEVDCAMPIRASALRGQLRFWWRLLYGAGRASEDVFEDERGLWGGIGRDGPQASLVHVRVACDPIDEGRLKRKAHEVDYALPHEDPRLLEQGYSFDVVVSFEDRLTDDERGQVLECLRWWANFGGVGARTRRGLGAVKVQCDNADLQPVTPDEIKRMGGWLVIGQPTDKQQAWTDAIGTLWSFRQGLGVGRARGSTGPGSSNWPEADTMRSLAKAGKAASNAGESTFFPRAAFGLPIVFQFKDEKHLNDTLEGEDHERMASPLILRPYFDGSRFRAMALLLPGWQERVSVAVKLKDSDRRGIAWPHAEGERSRLARDVEPMADRGSDPLTAFMHYFEERTGTARGRK